MPPPPSGESWHWAPERINADCAIAGPAGIKAACEIPDEKVTVATCHIHIERAVTQNKDKSFDDPENAAKMNVDIERLKNNSITSSLARAGKKLLVQKYKAAGETKGAEYFERVHSSATFTYAEVNERLSHEPEDQVEATVPTQSNGIERENLNQKAVNAWKREDCTSFLGSAFAALSQRSMSDLSFSQEMPRGYTTRQNISKEVWTAKFFAEVQAELLSPTGLDKLVWAATKIGPGVLVMASRALRSELVDDLGVLIGQPASQHVKLLRAAVFDGRAPEPSMLNEFMKLVVNTDKALKQKERFVQGGYNFDDLISWQKSFHILKPITSKAYLAGFVTRLKNGCSGSSGNGIKIDEAKLAEGKITLKICSCENGRHYGFCLHACIEAMSSGLIKGYPTNLDPTRIRSVKSGKAPMLQQAGRPSKAIKGGALGKK